MALRAGYKGIKKKYADAINNGQGGGGGGGSNYTKDVLYESTTYSENVAFTFPEGKNIDSYNQITIIYGTTPAKAVCEFTIDVAALKKYAPYDSGAFSVDTSPHLFLLIYTNDNLRVTLNSDNTGLIIKNRSGSANCIREVYGVKF